MQPPYMKGPPALPILTPEELPPPSWIQTAPAWPVSPAKAQHHLDSHAPVPDVSQPRGAGTLPSGFSISQDRDDMRLARSGIELDEGERTWPRGETDTDTLILFTLQWLHALSSTGMAFLIRYGLPSGKPN